MNQLSFQDKLEEKITLRMRSIANFVTEGCHIWDIGCDHGLIGLYAFFTRAGKSLKLIDESSKVCARLARLKDEHLKDRHWEIEVVHNRGESMVPKSAGLSVILAGLGSKTIARVIKGLLLSPVKPSEFVVSTHTGFEVVRAILTEQGYCCVEKVLIFEKNQEYFIEKYSLTDINK